MKVHAEEAKGKRAAELSDADLDRHLGQWRDEVDAMADHRVLPHIIAIVGDPFWSRACDSFRGDGFARVRVRRYEPCQGSCLYYVNRVTLDVDGAEHVFLLLRLRHPASRRATGSPRWLAQQPQFTAMLAMSRQG